MHGCHSAALSLVKGVCDLLLLLAGNSDLQQHCQQLPAVQLQGCPSPAKTLTKALMGSCAMSPGLYQPYLAPIDSPLYLLQSNLGIASKTRCMCIKCNCFTLALRLQAKSTAAAIG